MKHYLITYQGRPQRCSEWIVENAVIDVHPAAWLARTIEEYGEIEETRLTFAVEITAAQAKKLKLLL